MVKVLFLFLFFFSAQSQEVVLTSGEKEHSIGQVFYTENNGGIQIPIESENTLIINKLTKYLDIIVYPNPTKGDLMIEAIGDNLFKLFDLSGKMIRKKIIRNKDSFCLEGLPKGTYLLKHKNKVFKIIKL